MKKYTLIILAVFVISQLALSALILSLSSRAQRQRASNQQSQQVIQDYVRCIVLARFDYPEASLPNATREQVENALDGCAKKDS